jgi:hypothetical protein
MALVLTVGSTRTRNNLGLIEIGYNVNTGLGDKIGSLSGDVNDIATLIVRSNGKVIVKDSGGTDFMLGAFQVNAKGQALADCVFVGDQYEAEDAVALYEYLKASTGCEILLGDPAGVAPITEAVTVSPELQGADNNYLYGAFTAGFGDIVGTIGGAVINNILVDAEGPTHNVSVVLDTPLDTYALELTHPFTGEVIVLTAHDVQLGGGVLANYHFTAIVDVTLDNNTGLYEHFQRKSQDELSTTVLLEFKVIPTPFA